MKSIVNIAVIIFMFNEAINAQYNCVMVNPLPEKETEFYSIKRQPLCSWRGRSTLLHNGWSWTAIDSVTKSSLNLKAAVWTEHNSW